MRTHLSKIPFYSGIRMEPRHENECSLKISHDPSSICLWLRSKQVHARERSQLPLAPNQNLKSRIPILSTLQLIIPHSKKKLNYELHSENVLGVISQTDEKHAPSNLLMSMRQRAFQLIGRGQRKLPVSKDIFGPRRSPR
jgi:hypothetical protein